MLKKTGSKEMLKEVSNQSIGPAKMKTGAVTGGRTSPAKSKQKKRRSTSKKQVPRLSIGALEEGHSKTGDIAPSAGGYRPTHIQAGHEYDERANKEDKTGPQAEETEDRKALIKK